MNVLKIISSLKLTLPLMVLLWLAVLYNYRLSSGSTLWVAMPLLLLAVNLLAALIVNPRFRRQGGLLVFHLCLLVLLLLAAIGQLTSLKARIEITEGQWFDRNQLQILRAGPWHSYRQLEKISFQQAAVQVDYHPGLVRGSTRSDILFFSADRTPVRLSVGDNVPLRIAGYRFYTSSNKGFALVLTWQGEDGSEHTGSVHLPSYPLNDWRLLRYWRTPSGEEVGFQFRLDDATPTQEAWRLSRRTGAGNLTVTVGGESARLASGEWVKVKGGRVRFDDVRVWMGYQVFYNPVLPWLFATALVGVLGLGIHYWGKFGPRTAPAIIRGQVTENRGDQHVTP